MKLQKKLNVNRSTYANWENGDLLIPLQKIDELTLIYKKTLSYMLDIDNKSSKFKNIKPINYDYLIEKINNLKKENKYTYKSIANQIGISTACCYKYHKNLLRIPLDKLIRFSTFYKINIDKLCNKV